ncbi:MAG TPA: hypothetical protein VFZ77_24015 [Acidimicrobiales bacterium]
MGERPRRPRRVLIEDARRSGHHLRVTWHPDRRQFVVSTWSRDVCTGSSRLAVGDVAPLAGLLIDGVAEAATAPAAAPPAAPSGRPGLPGFVDRLRWLVRGTGPRPPADRAGEAGSPPVVHEARLRAANPSA